MKNITVEISNKADSYLRKAAKEENMSEEALIRRAVNLWIKLDKMEQNCGAMWTP